jgi:hypothetical protein
VKLSGKLPGDLETNGLDQMVEELTVSPDTIRHALIWFDVSKVTDDIDAGTHIPTVRVRRIEPLGDADQVSAEVRKLAMARSEERLGRTPLPFDSIDADDAKVDGAETGQDDL